MRARRAVPAIAAIVLATGVACGGDGRDEADDSGSTDTTAGASRDDDPRTDSERQADEASAQAMVLTLDDFPPGWEEGPADDEEADEELQADLARCLGVDPAAMNPDNPRATSPAFVSSEDQEVGSEVAFTPSVEDASRPFDILAADDAPECYAQAAQDAIELNTEREGLPEGVEFGEPTFSRLSYATLGDESLAFRITLPVAARGLDVDLYLDFVVARVGRIGITTTFQSVITPFDEDEAAALVQRSIDRAPAEETG